MFKKIISLAIALITILTLFNIFAFADYNEYLENELYSDSAVLICTDNDEVIFQKNMNKQSKPASMTKVITASVVLENCSDLTQVVTVPESCIRELDGTGSSMSGLKIGETITVYDLLCCLLIPSANDAATILANFITGDDRQAFVDKMNALAESLGCVNSHFMNVHGLDDDDQYTTPCDMAKFLKNAMQYSVFEEISGMLNYTLPESNLQKERTINSTNYTLNKAYKDYYCPYSKGGKRGQHLLQDTVFAQWHQRTAIIT